MNTNIATMETKKILTIVISVLISCSTSNAQLSKNQVVKLDSVVESWNKPMNPGGVVGIMEHGKLLYTKPFGLASLDYDIPNTDSTLFNIGSISKQFTAMGIVRLHLGRKLSIDDNIRKYLTELPEFGHEITIRHLLHHTSGLRSMHSILELAGWRFGDPRSNKDLFEIMKKQKDLNNIPGDEYIYSNTNYIFMAMIIEKVTGETFEPWMKDNIFIPLGLFDTYVEGTATNVVKENATSYRNQNDNSYRRAVEYWNYTGSGNVHTTAKDLLLWFDNFSTPDSAWVSAFELLQTTDLLNSGKYLNYAFGIVIDSINDIKKVSHGGGVGGFRSYACTFPDLSTSFVVLTNYSLGNSYWKCKSISEITISSLQINSDNEEKKTEDYKVADNDNLTKYEGDYWFESTNSYRKIYLKNDTLWYCRETDDKSSIQYIGNNEFVIMPEALWKIKFQFEKDSIVSMIVESDRRVYNFVSFEPVEITPFYLSEFVGTFYSQELESYYKIKIQGDSILSYHPRHGFIKLNALAKKDQFTGDRPLNRIVFERDLTNTIIGMKVSNGRVRNLWLEKIE